MDKPDYTQSQAYKLVQQYKELGELLMDPRTDLLDLAAAAHYFDCHINIELVPLNSAEEEITEDGV